MYQKLILLGNVGNDPEMRYFQDGTAVTSFSLAVNRSWKDGHGNKQDETTWFRISVFGRRAEVANQYITKGSKVLVEGRLKPDPNTGSPRLWTRQDGTVAASFEVTADNFSFVGSKSDSSGAGGDEFADGASEAVGVAAMPVDEDDVPF